MPVAKILLSGLSGAGKTESIRAVSHFPAQVVSKRVPKTQATLSLDYGRVFVSPYMVYLYSSALAGKMIGPDWAGLMQEMDCVVFVVNGTDQSAAACMRYYNELSVIHKLPALIAVNWVSDPDFNTGLYGEIQNALSSQTKIVLFDAVDQVSSQRMVAAAVEVIQGISHET